MIRVVIAQVVLFALPFLIYLIYRVLTGSSAGQAFASRRINIALTLSGFVLVLCGFVYLAVTGGTPDGVYVPAQYIDGELVPGGFRAREANQ